MDNIKTRNYIKEIERLRKALKDIDRMAEKLNQQYSDNPWIYEIAKILTQALKKD